MRLAAVSTNIGWAPGAIIIIAVDFARAWESSEVSAFTVRVRRARRVTQHAGGGRR